MKKMHQSGESRWKRFWQGRGFYVALAVCLVAVCGLAVTTFIDVLVQDSPEDPISDPSTAPTQPAGQVATGVPDDRTTTTTTETPTTTQPSSVDTVEPADLYVLPLTNEVLAEYSEQPVYSLTMQSWRVHTGTDFKGEIGQAVKAVADGTVQQVYTDVLWGDCLVIDHGYGVQSLYCGVTTSLAEGDTVKVGEEIGALSTIPGESLLSPHLHLEMRVSDKTVDPVKAIGREVKLVTDQPTETTAPTA